MRRIQWQSYVKEDGGMAGDLFLFLLLFVSLNFLLLLLFFWFRFFFLFFFTQSLMTWKGTSESDVFLIGEP